MKRIITSFLFFIAAASLGQTIGSRVPSSVTAKDNYAFYLHGGVVTRFGDNAVNESMPEWGRYEYGNILDSLRSRGFNVISERRVMEISDSAYVQKLVMQIDTLLRMKVRPEQILVIGASAGGSIALYASSALQNNRISYVILGACRDETYKEYERMTLHGRFLSIIEESDPHGTCAAIFKNRANAFNEVRLNTGLSHGFIYKGYKEWLDPLCAWFAE